MPIILGKCVIVRSPGLRMAWRDFPILFYKRSGGWRTPARGMYENVTSSRRWKIPFLPSHSLSTKACWYLSELCNTSAAMDTFSSSLRWSMRNTSEENITDWWNFNPKWTVQTVWAAFFRNNNSFESTKSFPVLAINQRRHNVFSGIWRWVISGENKWIRKSKTTPWAIFGSINQGEATKANTLFGRKKPGQWPCWREREKNS